MSYRLKQLNRLTYIPRSYFCENSHSKPVVPNLGAIAPNWAILIIWGAINKWEAIWGRWVFKGGKIKTVLYSRTCSVEVAVGFLARLKKEVPEVMTIHCVIYRQHLAAKKLSGVLHETLQLLITGVCKIKTNSLNDRLFWQLCFFKLSFIFSNFNCQLS